MSRVIDAFMFNGEVDMLRVRLQQLDGKVHRHVLVESPITHRGVGKPLVFRKHRFCCFGQWAHKIIPLVAELDPGAPWSVEHQQRDKLREGLLADPQLLRDDDMVLLADVDEIPSDSALAWRGTVAALNQRIFHSAVDWEYPAPQLTSVMVRGEIIRSRTTPALGIIRDGRYAMPVLQEAGWHFSWLGTDEQRRAKLYTTCHTDMDPQEWHDIESGATYALGQHHAGDATVKAVTVDRTWPRPIYERRCPVSWFRPREEAS